MKSTLVACAMMEDELNYVFEKTGCSFPVIWIDRGYHNTPEKLRLKLQETIDGLQDQDEILLAFGLCGNGTEGIVSRKATLILPQFDDCINMLLCTGERTTRALTKADAIYMTRGWMYDDESIMAKNDEYIENYGEETTQDILAMMYAHYQRIAIIDTESYPMEAVEEYADKAGSLLDLSIEKVKGSTKILEQLLERDWNENFIVQPPGEPLRSVQWNC